MHKKIIFLFTLFLLSAQCFASGFSIYEQSSRATGMAGAFIAQTGDASSIFYNPAAISQLKGLHFTLGSTVIQTKFAFTGPENIDDKKYTPAKEGLFTPAHFYGSYAFNQKIVIGLGIYSPFGLSSTWGDDQHPWVGQQLATYTNLQTLFVNPVVAYQPLTWLSVAAGFQLVRADVQMDKSVYFLPRNVLGKSSLTGQAMSYGWNLGIQFRPIDRITLGLTYRSNVGLKFKDGKAVFTFPDTGDETINREISAYFPAQTKSSAKLTLPASIGAGINFRFTENLSFELDYLWTQWSVFDTLSVKFSDPVAGQTQAKYPRNYQNSYAWRFGLEYRVIPGLFVRTGYAYDYHAVPQAYVEPSLPEGNRHNYSLGAGYTWKNLTIDGAIYILLQDDRKVENSVFNFNGEYSGLANLYSLSLSYAL